MIKKAGIILLILLIIMSIAGTIAVTKFNDYWFHDKPNHFKYTTDFEPINFEWATQTHDNYVELHEAIIIPVHIDGFAHHFYFQLDTGAPTSMIYGNSLNALKEIGLNLKEEIIDDQKYIRKMDFLLGGSSIETTMIKVMENYGSQFNLDDTIKPIKLGTLGADFFEDRLVSIDFSIDVLIIYPQRPTWMSSLSTFKSFAFKGRRFMFPATIKGRNLNLLYDSGCSAFGLITSKNRFDNYTDKSIKEITYEGNRFGESLTVHHKPSKETMKIGNAILNLRRISYVDIYTKYQKYMSPFSKIEGWLGNKPFIGNTLIIDTKNEEFAIIKGSINQQNQPYH